ncbi:hypothetical protein BKA66DRAFT_278434 [Pyrenochaeta sp. MPI-SDFR-AT-0127]|nr:hypothetical protein BKA66DRAFT_278434 [Pyrenochaeta sp. MPI-SDFR-AT-0127]
MALLLILVTAYQICLKIWRSAYRDFKCDLRRTQWLRGIGWTGGVIWLLGLIASAIYIGTAFLTDTSTACQPDGSFRLSPETYSMWSSSGFFQITLGGGHLTFAEAKVVDIVWDIGIGRGGQFILAFISWRVFVKYVTMCMEIEPVTYQLFRTIFIETEPSLPSTYRTIKSFIFQRRLRSRTAMTFMVVTMVFILAFPTLISAMSGYDANVGSHMRDRDDNLIPFQNFSRILYVVHDGWRINQDGNYWVTDVFYNPKSGDPVLGRSAICEGYYRHQNKTDCNLQNSVSEYVIAHGLGGRKNESTRFDNWTTGQNITLPAPALNITAYVSDDKRLGGQSSSGILEESWVRMNETFNITYIKENGTCQTMGVSSICPYPL